MIAIETHESKHLIERLLLLDTSGVGWSVRQSRTIEIHSI